MVPSQSLTVEGSEASQELLTGMVYWLLQNSKVN